MATQSAFAEIVSKIIEEEATDEFAKLKSEHGEIFTLIQETEQNKRSYGVTIMDKGEVITYQLEASLIVEM
jgi:hypothetical protein